LTEPRTGAALRAYLAAVRLAGPLLPRHLRRRVARGKEDPARWREKLGEATRPRPAGPLIWFHAVGLGEVLALRGLIVALGQARPDVSFLVTSSARSSAQAFAANTPPRTRHQFLPLDAPGPVGRFLDHWRPDLSVWAEQDLWPGAVVAAHARGIPLALINARMDARAFAARSRVRGLYRDLYARFRLISAQDDATARHMAALGAAGVTVGGSLKAAAGALADHPDRTSLAARLGGRRIWVAASTHPGDETVALAAQARLWAEDPRWLLILAPRDPSRREALAAAIRAAGLDQALRSAGAVPGPADAVWLADTFGEMGLWYRLAAAALVGGGFDAIGGHNPWEPALLGAAVLHGPDVANFRADYAAFHAAGAARQVGGAGDLAAALAAPDLTGLAERGRALALRGMAGLDAMVGSLLTLLDEGRAA